MIRTLLWLQLICFSALGQNLKLLNNIDSTFEPGNYIIDQYNYSSYFESAIGDIEIDLEQLDQNLLNAALHFSINALRSEKRRTSLRYNENLEFLAYNCVQYYSASKFKTVKKGRDKYERVLFIASRNMDLAENMISTNVAYVPLYNIQSNKKTYKHNGTYYYLGRDNKKTPSEDKMVEVFTYNQLAQEILRQFTKSGNKGFIQSASFSNSGCYIALDTFTVGRNSSPKFKVIQVVAGKRLNTES